jgi:type II secretory ATPase GspE/PulE/Tfp pilus assembly ATPase PilB-like protein
VTQSPTTNAVRQSRTDRASIRLLPEAYCRKNGVVIIGHVDPEASTPVLLGMLRPNDEMTARDVAMRLRRQVTPVRVSVHELERVIRAGFSAGNDAEDESRHKVTVDAPPATRDSTAVELMDQLITDAIVYGASDIHIETFAGEVVVRMRKDGIMYPVFSYINSTTIAEVMSRLKVLANLDISEKRRPQEGRFTATILRDGEAVPIDFRVSIVPSPAGEDAVIRVLDARVGLVPLHDLGMTREMQANFQQLLANPEGLILVTGPTGAGKTSTLYAALRHLRDGRRKIVTAEDPIEYYLEGICQKQTSAMLTMSELLRALLRHDPDVLLFGEIRDASILRTATQASSTGHLVLGTLHTSSAIGAIERLRGLEMTDGEIAGNLLAVVTQRLVRRVCPACATPTIPTEEQSALLGELLDGLSFLEGAGCEQCGGTGYRGRTGIYEMLVSDEGLQDLISRGSNRAELRAYARTRGFTSMVDQALVKVNEGVTTIDEILRVLPYRLLMVAAGEVKWDRIPVQSGEQRAVVAAATGAPRPMLVPEDVAAPTPVVRPGRKIGTPARNAETNEAVALDPPMFESTGELPDPFPDELPEPSRALGGDPPTANLPDSSELNATFPPTDAFSVLRANEPTGEQDAVGDGTPKPSAVLARLQLERRTSPSTATARITEAPRRRTNQGFGRRETGETRIPAESRLPPKARPLPSEAPDFGSSGGLFQEPIVSGPGGGSNEYSIHEVDE